jgi:hypothetical protein
MLAGTTIAIFTSACPLAIDPVINRTASPTIGTSSPISILTAGYTLGYSEVRSNHQIRVDFGHTNFSNRLYVPQTVLT